MCKNKFPLIFVEQKQIENNKENNIMANWNLDTAHSEIEFKVNHMMICTVKGQFENFNVSVENSEDVLDAAKHVSVEIKTGSSNTKNSQRDQHLKSEDFCASS